MIQYSQYSETNTMTSIMYLRINAIVGGKYIDYSGNDYHADVVTITEENDGIKLADSDVLREIMRKVGLFDLFYDTDGTPLEVIKSHIGRIYNNLFFNNGSYMMLCDEPLTGASLTATYNIFFGQLSTESISIISATGVTSELEQRLIDIHIKDLLSLNKIEENFFNFGNPDNSILKVVYGIIGDTISKVKYNWVNPLDSDAGNRLSLIQGSESIILANLINFDGRGCYTTHFNANLKLGNTNSFGYLSPFNLADGDVGKNITATDNSYEFGCLGVTGSYKGVYLAIRRDDGSHVLCEDTYQNPSKGIVSTEINSRAFYLTNKLASNDLKQFKDILQLGSTVTDAGTSVYYDGDIILGNASVDGIITTSKNSTMPCGYFCIGDAIPVSILKLFQEAIIRHCSSKIDYYFLPDETSRV